jgi:hypothetical protein
MTQSPEGDKAPNEQSPSMRRHWHAPEFHLMDVASTGTTQGHKNDGHEDRS